MVVAAPRVLGMSASDKFEEDSQISAAVALARRSERKIPNPVWRRPKHRLQRLRRSRHIPPLTSKVSQRLIRVSQGLIYATLLVTHLKNLLLAGIPLLASSLVRTLGRVEAKTYPAIRPTYAQETHVELEHGLNVRCGRAGA